MSSSENRIRYPFRAKVAVALAALFCLGELILLAHCLLPLIPLVPVFVMLVVGQACLLSSVVEWAASLAVTGDLPRGPQRSPSSAVAAASLGRAEPVRTPSDVETHSRQTSERAAAPAG